MFQAETVSFPGRCVTHENNLRTNDVDDGIAKVWWVAGWALGEIEQSIHLQYLSIASHRPQGQAHGVFFLEN